MAKNERKDGKKKARGGGGSGASTLYWILGVVAVLGVGAIGYAVGTGGSGDTVTAPLEIEGIEDPQRLVELARGVEKGEAEAPVTIMEFADFQCPACAQFASLTMPQIVSTFVETGEAKLVFHDFPLTSIHPHAFLAGRAARCAEDQGRFWEYHDALYANQAAWSGASSPPVGRFVEYAGRVGLDTDAFEECLESDRFADVVTANQRLAQELGLGGTPSIVVGGRGLMPRRVQSNNFQAIQQAVREAQQSLDAARGGPGADDTADGGTGEGAGGGS